MDRNEFDLWLNSQSVTCRRFIKFGARLMIGGCLVMVAQGIIWRLAGWGGANFLPAWALIACYVTAAASTLSVQYFIVSTADRAAPLIEFKVLGACVLTGVFCMWVVTTALAHSLPQLSTLIFSKPSKVEIFVFDSKDRRRGYKNYCPKRISFAPFHKFQGRWCGVYLPEGETYTFEGRGHAWAMRLNSVQH
ncbi:MAG: hypothetical protein AAF724_22915 [Pseudomonadota bacterium]